MVTRWQEKTSEPLYESRIFSIRRASFQAMGSGLEQDCYLVDSPDWVNVIALTPKRTVLFVRQFRFAARRVTLEIPGGMIDPGESPDHAAVRELVQETGHQAAQWLSLGSIDPNPALLGNRCYSFLATGCTPLDTRAPTPAPSRTPGRPGGDGEVLMEVLEHPLAEVPSLIAEGHITHALVAVAFQKLDLFERGLLKPP